ncbi:hypothetical protein CRUP_026737, partial [Coryphaenoides rupestris]
PGSQSGAVPDPVLPSCLRDRTLRSGLRLQPCSYAVTHDGGSFIWLDNKTATTHNYAVGPSTHTLGATASPLPGPPCAGSPPVPAGSQSPDRTPSSSRDPACYWESYPESPLGDGTVTAATGDGDGWAGPACGELANVVSGLTLAGRWGAEPVPVKEEVEGRGAWLSGEEEEEEEEEQGGGVEGDATRLTVRSRPGPGPAIMSPRPDSEARAQTGHPPPPGTPPATGESYPESPLGDGTVTAATGDGDGWAGPACGELANVVSGLTLAGRWGAEPVPVKEEVEGRGAWLSGEEEEEEEEEQGGGVEGDADHCRSLGGSLASVHNHAENRYLKDLLQLTGQTNVWIGAFYLQVPPAGTLIRNSRSANERVWGRLRVVGVWSEPSPTLCQRLAPHDRLQH